MIEYSEQSTAKTAKKKNLNSELFPNAISHPWNVSPREAVEIQNRLAKKVICRGELKQLRVITGVDAAFDETETFVLGAAVSFTFPRLQELERASAKVPLTFPYVPGLLSFREGPAVITALDKLKFPPDLLIFDGQGIAHPRRLGIAAHMGILLDRPSIGCAKSRLCGRAKDPDQRPGAHRPLSHQGQVIGTVLRTKRGCNPVYVSIGHRVSLSFSRQIILRCLDGYRLPKPTRWADRFSKELKRVSP